MHKSKISFFESGLRGRFENTFSKTHCLFHKMACSIDKFLRTVAEMQSDIKEMKIQYTTIMEELVKLVAAQGGGTAPSPFRKGRSFTQDEFRTYMKRELDFATMDIELSKFPSLKEAR